MRRPGDDIMDRGAGGAEDAGHWAMLWRQLMDGQSRVGRSGPAALLDVGSSKLCCYVTQPRPGRGFALLGRGYKAADGLRAGEIVDAEAADDSIRAVLAEAEDEAGETLREIAVVWSGGEPASELLRIERELDGRAIGEEDLRWGLEMARQRAIAGDREILHILPLEIRIDGGRPLKDPRGLAGQTLEMVVAVATVAAAPLGDLLACLKRCHLDVTDVASSAYAAGIGCLTADEAERGCLLLDMGGGTTNIAHFHGQRLAHLDQVAYGGDHVTRDLAYGLNTGHAHAERIKNLFGSVQWRACDDNVRIAVPVIGDDVDHPTGEIPRTRLTQINRARVEEIFNMVRERLRKAWEVYENKPPRSMVLTGGAAQLEGIDELAEEMFALPARIGRPGLVQSPKGVEDQPCCSAASGGLVLIAGDDGGLSWKHNTEVPVLAVGLARFGRWLRQNFVS